MVEYGFEQKSFQTGAVKFIFVFLLVMVLFVWAVYLSPDHAGLLPRSFHKELLVDFINVGQGDAILIQTPTNKYFLVDGGVNVPMSEAQRNRRELVHHYLRKKGISRLHGVVVTHPHNDHIGGLVPVVKQYDVDRVWEVSTNFQTATVDDFKKYCKSRRIPRIPAKAGDVLDWGEELFVQVLHPDHAAPGTKYSDSDMNNLSVTLLIRYGKFSMLLTGDIEEDTEAEVAQYGEGLKCQVLKVPHHGSETSLYQPFLNLVKPEYGIIQVGRNNPFRHPSAAALQAYRGLGTKIYRTDHHGNVRLIVGGEREDDFRLEVDRSI